jgi:hypothetical protein
MHSSFSSSLVKNISVLAEMGNQQAFYSLFNEDDF